MIHGGKVIVVALSLRSARDLAPASFDVFQLLSKNLFKPKAQWSSGAIRRFISLPRWLLLLRALCVFLSLRPAILVLLLFHQPFGFVSLLGTLAWQGRASESDAGLETSSGKPIARLKRAA